ncbi:hypothetical protein [Larkinella soli]|uniref:hypothetical protein n=1 Tax=Larkinella soli TaxID=1770527 RepID=UPI000FFB11F5|nr:hypothetical protein [Larkinella soli]
MLVIVSGFLRGVECPYLVLCPEDIVAACEYVNDLAGSGFSLTRVQFKDDGFYLDLPPEIFDGQSFREPMTQLQSRWRHLIEAP